MNHKLLNNRGFTLIELIVVIAIIAILAAIAIPSYIGCVETAHCAVCISNRATVKQNLIIYNIEDYNGELSLEELYSTPEIQKELAQYTCPSNGTWYVSDDEIHCTVHDDKNAGGDGNTDDGSETITDWEKNYPYEADAKYTGNTSYQYGEIVEHNGILYRCIAPEKSASFSPGIYGVDSLTTWQVAGAVGNSDIEFTLGHHYAVGTIVKDKGDNYYMFTPPYNNTKDKDKDYSYYLLSDESVWTKIDKNSSLKKPPEIAKAPSNVKNYSSGTTYSKGDHCLSNGVLYQYTGATSSNNSIYYGSVDNGTWTQVSNIYIYKDAKYNKGDKVWYQGQYYTATENFTTYADHTVPGANARYWKVSD